MITSFFKPKKKNSNREDKKGAIAKKIDAKQSFEKENDVIPSNIKIEKSEFGKTVVENSKGSKFPVNTPVKKVCVCSSSRTPLLVSFLFSLNLFRFGRND